MNKLIPLSVPYLNGNEWIYVKECIDTGWISTAGSFVEKFEKQIAKYTGAEFAVACMNGTSGLHIAQIISGVETGDYILCPNITFIATLNAIKYTGAEPILFDIDPDTWQLDLNLVEQFLEEHTISIETNTGNKRQHRTNKKRVFGILPVHALGNMPQMDSLLEIAKKYNLEIIEDAAESLGTFYKGQSSGTFGRVGVFSFNGNKIISTGGGGMIVTNDETLAKKAKHLTTQAKISPDEYIHDEIGYNYRLVNVLAALGVAQMEQFEDILKRKKSIETFYRNELDGVEDINFQKITDHVETNSWLFTFRTNKMRALIQYLKERNILSRPLWTPMNTLPMFSDSIYVTEHNFSSMIYNECISIPSSANLSEEDLYTVTKTIKNFFKK